MKLQKTIAGAMMFAGILWCTQAFAVDELYLCGVVREVNPQVAQVTVDVVSANCRGLRTFKLPPVTNKNRQSFTVNDRKCFLIDSNRCKAGYVHAITKVVPE